MAAFLYFYIYCFYFPLSSVNLWPDWTIWVTRWVSYKKQELLTLPEHLGSLPLLVGSMLLILLVVCVYMFCLVFILCLVPNIVYVSLDCSFFMFCLVFILCLVPTIVYVSLDCSFFITHHSRFSYVYFFYMFVVCINLPIIFKTNKWNVSVKLTFFLWSHRLILSGINELTLILKIIGQSDVKQ
jgi:hypothetical protein